MSVHVEVPQEGAIGVNRRHLDTEFPGARKPDLGRTPDARPCVSGDGKQAGGSDAADARVLMMSHLRPKVLYNRLWRFPFKPPALLGVIGLPVLAAGSIFGYTGSTSTTQSEFTSGCSVRALARAGGQGRPTDGRSLAGRIKKTPGRNN
jgi:hypothetical protein